MKSLECFPIPDAQTSFIPKSLLHCPWESCHVPDSSQWFPEAWSKYREVKMSTPLRIGIKWPSRKVSFLVSRGAPIWYFSCDLLTSDILIATLVTGQCSWPPAWFCSCEIPEHNKQQPHRRQQSPETVSEKLSTSCKDLAQRHYHFPETREFLNHMFWVVLWQPLGPSFGILLEISSLASPVSERIDWQRGLCIERLRKIPDKDLQNETAGI